ncbi:MAG TPA: methionyl-tRNA formyltransferase [Actinomycetota bacterium]|nr:methionyl-tRNA formyltransferase [Actinomycetota bacterium]
MFFGTPAWAVPSLNALIASPLHVAAVVTNPDRPTGRAQRLTPPTVKTAALDAGVPVLQPEKVRDPEFEAALRDLAPEVCPVVAFGRILPASLLAVPPRGFVNLHFSLLPAYRGAAPVQRAVMAGETKTGISTMVLTEGMDEGPLLARLEVPIQPGETAGELGARLAELGAEVLVESLTSYLDRTLEPVPQDDASATYAPKITTEEARIRWTDDAASIAALVRGTNPEPGAWTTHGGTRIKIFAVAPLDTDDATETSRPGVLAPGRALVVGTGTSPLVISEAQRAGGRRMSGTELALGLRMAPGDAFG